MRAATPVAGNAAAGSPSRYQRAHRRLSADGLLACGAQGGELVFWGVASVRDDAFCKSPARLGRLLPAWSARKPPRAVRWERAEEIGDGAPTYTPIETEKSGDFDPPFQPVKFRTSKTRSRISPIARSAPRPCGFFVSNGLPTLRRESVATENPPAQARTARSSGFATKAGRTVI